MELYFVHHNKNESICAWGMVIHALNGNVDGNACQARRPSMQLRQ
jgi:hypothetical protein